MQEFADFTPNEVTTNMGNLNLKEKKEPRSKPYGSDNNELYAEASDYDSDDGTGDSDVASRASTRPPTASNVWKTVRSAQAPGPALRPLSSNRNSHLGNVSHHGATSTIVSSVPGSRPRRAGNFDDVSPIHCEYG